MWNQDVEAGICTEVECYKSNMTWIYVGSVFVIRFLFYLRPWILEFVRKFTFQSCAEISNVQIHITLNFSNWFIEQDIKGDFWDSVFFLSSLTFNWVASVYIIIISTLMFLFQVLVSLRISKQRQNKIFFWTSISISFFMQEHHEIWKNR